jgi:XTP/dITP diphosphohydrolase
MSPTERLLVATRNVDKLREIRQILADAASLEIVGLDDAGISYTPEEEDLECFDSFEDNARAKARYFARRSGLPTLADDSGLCVDALAGAPGVRSRRFASGADGDQDRANNELLLQRLEGVEEDERTARYVCALALVPPRGREHVVTGECHGLILSAARGIGGFGYDPLFFIPEEGLTFGELPPSRKNRISHRARALHALRPKLAGPVDAASSER